MAVNIKDPEADRLVRALAEELTALAVRCASLPLLDDRPEEQVLGYDEHGQPT